LSHVKLAKIIPLNPPNSDEAFVIPMCKLKTEIEEVTHLRAFCCYFVILCSQAALLCLPRAGITGICLPCPTTPKVFGCGFFVGCFGGTGVLN
jgi:hypothetical protein